MAQLSTSTKMLYGLGFSARGIKDGMFQLFLFFYFSQVLGLDAALAGTASVIALLFDAVSDPLVGLISDKWQSRKWGRRHPFMFASALPLGVFSWLLFAPPAGLDQSGLFLWLTTFSVLVRLALTFFLVPHISLGAELTTDYQERTVVTSYRIMFAAFVSPVIMIIGFLGYFRPSPAHTNGLFNIGAYPDFALLCGILMVVSILISAWGTRHVIPTLPQPSEAQLGMSAWKLLGSLGQALRMRAFSMLMLYVMVIYVGLGIGVVFTTYFITYYFGLSTTEMALLPIGSAVGGILALFIAPRWGRLIDKKWSALWASILFALFFTLPYNLRLVGFFPENGSPALIPLFVGTLIPAYTFLWVALSQANSMMADVVDEFELRTGKRQEGLFFACMSFAFKCTTGLGSFIAGLLLNWIEFPRQVELDEVPARALQGLGQVGGPILLTFYLAGITFILFYPLTRSKYLYIRKRLDERHAHAQA